MKTKRLICFIGVHRWVMGLLVNHKGIPVTLYRECTKCHKYQEISKPKIYHPSKYEWKNSDINTK